MPKVKANNITMYYDQQGTGEPLILIPNLAAEHACYAFQVPMALRSFVYRAGPTTFTATSMLRHCWHQRATG